MLKGPVSERLPALVWVIASLFVALELAVSARYGFLQDEMYFIVAGHHLAFGYVDQPPLTPLVNRITGIFGVNPAAVRIVPALAGGLVVVSAAKFAALFGAGRFGRVLAALVTACTPLVLALAHLGITEALDLLAWTAVPLCVLLALWRHQPRWWLGVGIAAVIWAPNVIWQATHGWPQLAMASALRQSGSTPSDYAAGVPAQLVFAGLLHQTVADGVLAPWHRSSHPAPWRPSLLAPGCQSHRTVSPAAWRSCRVRRVRAGHGAPRVPGGDRAGAGGSAAGGRAGEHLPVAGPPLYPAGVTDMARQRFDSHSP